MGPYILVVEDDHLQEGPLAESLTSVVAGADVETMSTEQAFRQSIPRLRQQPPDLVVMDVMLRWSFPSPDAAPPPDDVVADGYYRAGLRCASLLLDDERLRDVPVLLYTILERSDLERDGQSLPKNTEYLGKNSDLGVLSRRIHAFIRGQRRPLR
jgi:CheY-like chemotaxis protein